MAEKKAPAFTAEEKAAMKQRAKELKENATKGEALKGVLAAFKKMAPADRLIAENLHTLVGKAAPELWAKTWYGMPAYSNAEGKTVLFFQDAGKFKSRYATLGFSDTANLDEGALWPTSYALVKWTPAVEKQVSALIKKAVK